MCFNRLKVKNVYSHAHDESPGYSYKPEGIEETENKQGIKKKVDRDIG